MVCFRPPFGRSTGRASMSAPVKVCGCQPHDDSAAHTGGRRTQTSKGGNRGRYGEAARQTLWGFGRRRSVAETQYGGVLEAVEGVTKPVRPIAWSHGGDRTTRWLSRAAYRRVWVVTATV